MKIEVKSGKYIVAVSGGVDSMVLLDLLAQKPNLELVVAHFNHGIRRDAAKDEALVRKASGKLGLPFKVGYGRLGAGVSEDAARRARYQFLEKIQKSYQAKAIITAHHQDDLVETAIINLLRGTGRRGLAALAINPQVTRPLLGYTKLNILQYANKRQLTWREDASNLDDVYLRNYIRHRVIPGLTTNQRQMIVDNINKITKLEPAINSKITKMSESIDKNNVIDRRSFIALPAGLGNELVLHWLRRYKINQPDNKTVRRINLILRSSASGKVHAVGSGLNLFINRETAHFGHSL